MKRLFLIDAMAQAYRSFFAFSRNPLTRSDGLMTSAIYGTAVFLHKLITEEKPDYLAVVTDSSEPTFRHELYSGYKQTRDRLPDSLADQLPHIFELFRKFGCPPLAQAGVEADDLIGSIARRFSGDQVHVYIVSGDKDFMQLVDDQTFMYTPKKGESAILVTRKDVYDKFQCSPERVIDCLALIGDTVDNVPGVKGVGDKGAAKLISEFGSLNELYERIDELKSKKQQQSLIDQRDAAFLSKELVTIKTDIPLEFELDDLRCDPVAATSNQSLLDFYEEMEFRQLATRAKGPKTGNGAVGSEARQPTPPKKSAKVSEIASRDALVELTDRILASKEVGFEVLGDGDVVANSPRDIGICLGDEAYSLRIGGAVSEKDVVDVLEPAVASGKTLFAIHDLKPALHYLDNLKRDGFRGTFVDTMILDYLVDPNYQNHKLGSCLARHLGQEEEPLDVAGRAQAGLRLYRVLWPKIKSNRLTSVVHEIEMPLVPVIVDMEKAGVFVDAEFLSNYSATLDKKAKRLQAEIYDLAGETFNINSTKQLQQILFEKLKVHEIVGLKRIKRTKTGYSTDESVMMKLAAHPIAKLILEYREVTKIKSTYVDALPQYVHQKTMRLHTSLHQTVAATGRLSSDKPNLQNIPMRSDIGQEIRKAFRTQNPGDFLLSADYSQVEVRLLAHLAKASELIEAFKQGLDIHTVTAAKVFGVSIDDVDPTMRSRAKAVNFGIIYGMGPQRLAQETGVSLGEAKEFIEKYFQVYPGIKKYTESLIQKARSRGFTETMTGRRRPLIGIGDANKAVSARAENIAVNAPIQGSAADLIKLAMIHIDRAFRDRSLSAKMLLQVHDELLFECPKEEVEQVSTIVRAKMEHAFETTVPLKVEVGYGPNWLSAH